MFIKTIILWFNFTGSFISFSIYSAWRSFGFALFLFLFPSVAAYSHHLLLPHFDGYLHHSSFPGCFFAFVLSLECAICHHLPHPLSPDGWSPVVFSALVGARHRHSHPYRHRRHHCRQSVSGEFKLCCQSILSWPTFHNMAEQLASQEGEIRLHVDRSQSLFYFVPQEFSQSSWLD